MIFIAEAGLNQARVLGELPGQGRAWHSCATPDEIIRQARRATEPVVAVGGDRTVNYCINGLMMSGGKLPFGLLPVGGPSDFCRCNGIPTDTAAALQVLMAGHSRPLDLAEASLTGGGSEKAVCYFSCGARLSVGASGDPGGPGQGLRRLAAACRHHPFTCYLTLDAEKFEFKQADYLLIFKNPILATALNLPEAARGLDGRLTLLLFHNASKIRLAELLSLLAQRKPLPRANVFARAFSKAAITNNAKLPVEFQGEAIGFTPMEVRLRPGLLNLIGPQCQN